MKLIALSLALVSCVTAAPVPKYRPAPVTDFAPGVYRFEWDSVVSEATFTPDKGHSYLWGGTVYRGTWHWDAKTRMLYVNETTVGEHWEEWSVKLDREFKGMGNWRGRNDVRIAFKSVKRGAK